MTSSPVATPNRSRGRLLLLSGLCLAVLGMAAYAVQLLLARLMVPWYMPAMTLLGVVLIAMSVRKARTLSRVLALLASVVLAGLQLAFLSAVRLPPYTGPIAAGRPFPAFEARRADGTVFTERDLTGDQNHVLVFFRGRW